MIPYDQSEHEEQEEYLEPVHLPSNEKVYSSETLDYKKYATLATGIAFVVLAIMWYLYMRTQWSWLLYVCVVISVLSFLGMLISITKELSDAFTFIKKHK